jgi:putative Mg2+ transporter-C (MgtC) family protein
LPKSRWTPSLLQVSYQDGREILRDVLVICTQHHFTVSRLQVERTPPPAEPRNAADPPRVPGEERTVTVVLEVQGTGSVSKLAAKLADIDGVASVNAGDVNVLSEE